MNIIIRNAIRNSDLEQIKNLFYTVFYPERVDQLAQIFFNHLPGMTQEDWFLAEDTDTGKIVAGFALIPWEWHFNTIPLKIAEMGMVATLPEYRGKGLMKLLNIEFNKTLEKDNYHLAVIQGIPGFYQKFGYQYALPLEHHVLLKLSAIQFNSGITNFKFRMANVTDIPFLMEQDALFSHKFNLAVSRSATQWDYLFTHGKQSEYASEFWIMESAITDKKYYCRIMLQGFGKGLIVSEISENISENAFNELMVFLKELSVERGKPFMRFNISHQSSILNLLTSLGAQKGKSYGWQIKIPSKLRLLELLTPLFEKRLSQSTLSGYSGIFRLNFYTHSLDLTWQNGKLKSIEAGNDNEVETVLSLCDDLFPALCLGNRSWEELQYIRPDIFPGNLYIEPEFEENENFSQQLTEILFPKVKSWINGQY